jgi:SPP1 family holin
MKNVKTETIVRTVILIVALINQALTVAGKSLLPITDDQITEVITLVITIGASLWAWWKNNSFTQAAIEADKVKDQLKSQED